MRFAYGRVLALSLLAGALGAGCDAPPPELHNVIASSSRRGSLENDFVIPAQNPLGVKRSAITAGSGPKGEQILFINYAGVTITKTTQGSVNPDDATLNRSWIPDVGGGATATFPAFDPTPFVDATNAAVDTGPEVTAAITQQVKDWYATYNVLVVTTRPVLGDGVCPASGSCLYQMIVVGGQTANFVSGQGSAVGVAPLDCGNDSQVNIGFAFSGDLVPGSPTPAEKQIGRLTVAQTIAHEAGHSFGLEHVNSPNPNAVDIMEPAVSQNVDSFLMGNQPIAGASTCVPAQSQEDTSGRLTNNLGPAPPGGVAPTKPTVSWLAPKTGTSVPKKFIAAIHAQTTAGTITKVEIVQAGATNATFTAPPYQTTFTADPSTPDGTPVRFTAIAYNSVGGKASVATDFTIQSATTQGPIPCLDNTDCQSTELCQSSVCVKKPENCIPACNADQFCMDGVCMQRDDLDMASTMMTVPTEVGKTCADSSECGTGGLCATADGKKYCTLACDPNNASVCGNDYECVAVGADHLCGPKKGGCAYAPGAAPASPLGLLLALVALGLARRRLRPSAA